MTIQGHAVLQKLFQDEEPKLHHKAIKLLC